jgi:hypothetical protein
VVPEPKSKIRDHELAASRFTQVEIVKSARELTALTGRLT